MQIVIQNLICLILITLEMTVQEINSRIIQAKMGLKFETEITINIKNSKMLLKSL